jgi:hypothetical protein
MVNVPLGLMFEHSALCSWSVRVTCAVLTLLLPLALQPAVCFGLSDNTARLS